MRLIGSPSVSGTAREFLTTYTNFGGERYSVLFGSDSTATNFFYDTWIYLASPMNDVANIEMDLNQVMSNGETVIFGFQCDGWSGTWDYTTNRGTPQKSEGSVASLHFQLQPARVDYQHLASRSDPVLARQPGQRHLPLGLV